MEVPKPTFEGEIPHHNDQCPNYDGKGCGALGYQPSQLCEPFVKEMADRLQSISFTVSAWKIADQFAKGSGIKIDHPTHTGSIKCPKCNAHNGVAAYDGYEFHCGNCNKHLKVVIFSYTR